MATASASSARKIVSLPKLIQEYKGITLKQCPIWYDDGINMYLGDDGKCSMSDVGGMSIDAAYRGTYTIDETATPFPTIEFSIKDANDYCRVITDHTVYTFSLQYILYEEERMITVKICDKIYDGDEDKRTPVKSVKQDKAEDGVPADEDEGGEENDEEDEEEDDEDDEYYSKMRKVTHTIHLSGSRLHCGKDYPPKTTRSIVTNDLGANHGYCGFMKYVSVFYINTKME
jgi:hypothetical protein